MQTMHSNVLAPENMASGGSDVVAPIMPLPVRQTRTLAEAQAQALDDTAVTTVDEGVRVKGLVKHVRATWPAARVPHRRRLFPSFSSRFPPLVRPPPRVCG